MSKKIRPLPRGYNQDDMQKRVECLQEVDPQWQQHQLAVPEMHKGIIENQVGCVPMPLAIAGPALINGTYAKGLFHIPVATIEGTLVLSMTRGLYAASLSGGIETVHIKQELSRSPIFHFSSLQALPAFEQWVKDNFAQLKAVAEKTTRHGKLLRIDSYVIDSNVILDCVFNTAEAAGQNMVTIAAKAICDSIIEQVKDLFGAIDYHVESNFNGDKNIAMRNLMLGRGHRVVARTVIKNKVLRRVLNYVGDFSGKDSVDAAIGFGSIAAGTVGRNLHVANGLAAIYLATGQDVACIVENAGAITTWHFDEKGDWHMSTTFPSLSIGTVGGGTRLPQQRQNLELLGCQGENSSKKLAEIIAAACLGLEISLAAAVASKEFALAHEQFGR
jgi:hydroxymethylglutaryl-CoA reductase (NADPH)